MVETGARGRTVAVGEVVATEDGLGSGVRAPEAEEERAVAVVMAAVAAADAAARVMVYTWWRSRFRPNIQAR